MSPALFVLAALVATPEEADSPIAYQVQVVEMEGLGWRSAHAERLKRVERPGVGAIWTGASKVAGDLVKASGRVINTDRVAARPEGIAEIVHGGTGPIDQFVRHVSLSDSIHGKRPTAPMYGASGEALHVEVTGRRLDQGILASVEVENTWVTATHAIPTAECSEEADACCHVAAEIAPPPQNENRAKVPPDRKTVRPDPNPTQEVPAARVEFVPEVAHARVVGEWLIPSDGVLIVSLGAHSAPGSEGKFVVRERLALIEVVAADARTTAEVCPAEGPVARPANLPPLPEDIDLRPAQDEACRIAEGLDVKHADTKSDQGSPADDATRIVNKAGALPMPALPGRSLPQGFTPDGSPAPPTKQDEDVKPTAGDGPEEPRPTPQATPQAGPSAKATTEDIGPDRSVPFETLCETEWPLSLPQAIRTALLNCGTARTLRVINPGKPTETDGLVIAPGPDVDSLQFQAELMAMVRSVEQQYWALSQMESRAWSLEVAIELAEEALRGELVKFEQSVGPPLPDLAGFKAKLEALREELVTANAEIVTTERQFRNILGLKPTDGRRIHPSTQPSDTRVKPVWEECLATMVANQPDILREKAQLNEATGAPLVTARDNLDRVVLQTTQSMARFYLEVTTQYREFQSNHQLRERASNRMEAQQAFDQADQIPLEKYLDAIRDWTSAFREEIISKTTYNTAIVCLEEAQGTLLARKGIVVASSDRVEPEVKRTSFEEPARPEPRSFCWNIPLDGARTVNIRVSTTHVTPERNSTAK